jgi:hypothetical protein
MAAFEAFRVGVTRDAFHARWAKAAH